MLRSYYCSLKSRLAFSVHSLFACSLTLLPHTFYTHSMNNENAIPEPIKHVSEKQIRAGRGQLIQRLTAALVGLLAGAFFLFLGIPLVALLVREPPATLWAALQQPDAFSALQLSVVTTTISTILTVLFGLPVAYVLARTRVPGRAFLETLVTMPTVLPPVVAGVALLIAFGRVGLIGRYLAPFGIELPFTTVAVVMAQMFVSAPFFVNTTRAGLEQLDRRYEQAAYTLRASPFYTFRRVVLPLIRPALLSGAGLGRIGRDHHLRRKLSRYHRDYAYRGVHCCRGGYRDGGCSIGRLDGCLVRYSARAAFRFEAVWLFGEKLSLP